MPIIPLHLPDFTSMIIYKLYLEIVWLKNIFLSPAKHYVGLGKFFHCMRPLNIKFFYKNLQYNINRIGIWIFISNVCINYCIHIVSAHFVINMLPMFCIKKLHNHIRIFLVRQKHDINLVVQVFQVQSSPCFTTCLLENPSSSHFHFPQLHCSDIACQS